MDLTFGHPQDVGTYQPPAPSRFGRRSEPVARVSEPVTLDLRRSAEMAAVVECNESSRINRYGNIVLAAIAIIVLLPVFLLVALLVRLTSPGPIFYTQTRVGLDHRRRSLRVVHERRARNIGGSIFTIYKFRSMYVDAEQKTGAVWASKHDPRVTPFGRIMRKTRLDELPQLFNVLKGEMNIVGPRPERPSIFVQLREEIGEYPIRQLVKPGITGWAQINHAYDTCIDDVKRKLHFDLEYMRRRSLGEDLKIMAMTVPTMVLRKGGW
jgi:lipopolysaccharide/colanic/teichoic acid biosynthesis glycosyltransferase